MPAGTRTHAPRNVNIPEPAPMGCGPVAGDQSSRNTHPVVRANKRTSNKKRRHKDPDSGPTRKKSNTADIAPPPPIAPTSPPVPEVTAKDKPVPKGRKAKVNVELLPTDHGLAAVANALEAVRPMAVTRKRTNNKKWSLDEADNHVDTGPAKKSHKAGPAPALPCLLLPLHRQHILRKRPRTSHPKES